MDVVPIVAYLDFVESGMVSVRGTIGDSAIRALMRVEAELLLEDADALNGSSPQRTEGQRRADALALLGHEVALALGIE